MQTMFVGRNLIDLEVVASTNDYALDLIRTGRQPEGTAVIAKYQQKGKGQYGKRWDSEPGENLIASFIFYPVFLTADHLFAYNQAISLAVADFIKNVLPVDKSENLKIKWPNDIVVFGKKISGVLIENNLRGNLITASVVGIGININQLCFGPHIPNSTSLSLCTGMIYDISECFCKLCKFLEARYMQLRGGQKDFLDKEYNDSLYLLGETTEFLYKDGRIAAVVSCVSENGQLMLELPDNKKLLCRAGEVKFLL